MTENPFSHGDDPDQPPTSMWARGAVSDSAYVDVTEAAAPDPYTHERVSAVPWSAKVDGVNGVDGVALDMPLTSEIQLVDTRKPSAPRSRRRRRGWFAFVAVFAVGVTGGIVMKSILGGSSAQNASPTTTVTPVQTAPLDGVPVPPADGTVEASSSADSSADSSVEQTVVYTSGVDSSDTAGDPILVSDSSTGAPLDQLGAIFGPALYVGDYGAIDPAKAPEFEYVQPTTAAGIDRWLSDGETASLHWAIKPDAAETGAKDSLVSWRVPVEVPPAWRQIQSNSDFGVIRNQVGSRVQFTVATVDGTWVEVTVGAESEEAFQDWLRALSELPTAADTTAPPGYEEVPNDHTDYGLRYVLTQFANPFIVDVATVRFEHDLGEHESRLWMSAYGALGPPVSDFASGGTLYPYLPSTEWSAGDPTSVWRYVWEVNPRLYVLMGTTGDSKTADEIAQFAHAMTLWATTKISSTSDGSAEADAVVAPLASYFYIASFGVTDWGSASDFSLVDNVRFGKLATDRFVYLESKPSGPDQTRCGVLLLGSQASPADCRQLVGEPDGPLCVYRIDRESTGGFRTTVLIDAAVADKVSIDGDSLSQLSPTGATATSGTSGGRPWTIASALSPYPVEVTGAGVHCDPMG